MPGVVEEKTRKKWREKVLFDKGRRNDAPFLLSGFVFDTATASGRLILSALRMFEIGWRQRKKYEHELITWLASEL